MRKESENQQQQRRAKGKRDVGRPEPFMSKKPLSKFGSAHKDGPIVQIVHPTSGEKAGAIRRA